MNMVVSPSRSSQPSSDEIDREARQIVGDIGIPPCPAILTRLLREMREDEPDFPRIGTMLSSDISLAASMLKTVNSPFYGLGKKATSIQQALVLLGLQNVARLVTGLLLRQVFSVSSSAAMEDFWRNAARLAAATAHLARTLGCADRDEAYTFGLFRDCGMPLMAGKYHDYERLLNAKSLVHGQALLDVEEEHYAVNHALVGFHMATSWYLAPDLCVAIERHHDLRILSEQSGFAKSRLLVALGMLAERILAVSEDEPAVSDAAWAQAGPAVLQCLGIGEDALAELAVDFLKMEI